MRKAGHWLLGLALLLAVATAARAQTIVDPCPSTSPKASAAISISSATTTLLVAGATGQYVHLCSGSFSIGGTTPTFELVEGTQTTTPCDTNQRALSGQYTASSVIPAALTTMTAGDQLCAVTGGTPTVGGALTYVRQAP